jgi:chaperonin GroEL (HSP60 family)
MTTEPPEGSGGSADSPGFPQANFGAVRAIAGALATTLGPTPRDKLVVEALETRSESPLPGVKPTDDLVVTSDGGTLLEVLDLDHPVAPIVERMVGPERPGETDVEGEDVTDGVTSTVVLAAALLDEAGELLDRGLHPTAIVEGYRAALATSRETLASLARPLDSFADERSARRDVASAAMTGNAVGGRREAWAAMADETAGLVGEPTPERFHVMTTRSGSIDDSRLVRGAVLPRDGRVTDEMPRSVEDATVLVLDGQDEGGLRSLELDDSYTLDASSPGDVAAMAAPEERRRDRIVDRLVEAGVDVVVARQGIESAYARRLADRGILGVDGVTPLHLDRVRLATGATSVLKTDEFAAEDLGRAGRVHEESHELVHRDRRKRRRMLVFDDCPAPGSVCALVRGVSGYLADQVTTELRTAAAAVAAAQGPADHRGDRGGGTTQGILPGGCSADVRVAAAVRETAPADASRRQLSIEAFADAVEWLPRSLAKNAGMDARATLADLRAANRGGRSPHGLRLPDGDIIAAADAGLLDAIDTRRSVYVTAVEVAELLVAIDDVVAATFSEDEPDPDDAVHEEPAEQQQSYLERAGGDG